MSKMKLMSSSRQCGAAAVEMALVFPLLFGVTYASIVYGYIFYLQQSINFFAEESARAAVASAIPTGTAGAFTGSLTGAAIAQFNALKTTLAPGNPLNATAIVPSVGPGASVGGVTTTNLTVTVTLASTSFAGAGSGFARVVLPMNLGTFPPLPPVLSAIAITAVN